MRKLSVGVLIMVIFLFTSCNTNTINDETSSSPVISELENNGLLALEQQLYKFDDEFEFIYTNMINAK